MRNETMTSYEFTGRSVKDAIAKACEELNVEKELLVVEVLEESTRGFLGIVGHRDARVRVRKREVLTEVMEAPEPTTETHPEEEVSPLSQLEDFEDSPDDSAPPAEAEPTPFVDPSVFLDEAKTLLEEILRRIPVEAEVEATVAEGAVYLDIKGDGSGLLIGKKGQTLDALQFLVNKIVNKNNTFGSKVEVIVDTENYRVRKRENLRETAMKTSEKAKKSLRPVSLNPMPAAERRIIHLILAEDKDVYTKSYGEGPMRRIIVYPRRSLASKRRRR
jgi:spoIIIJ-associated protein